VFLTRNRGQAPPPNFAVHVELRSADSVRWHTQTHTMRPSHQSSQYLNGAALLQCHVTESKTKTTSWVVDFPVFKLSPHACACVCLLKSTVFVWPCTSSLTNCDGLNHTSTRQAHHGPRSRERERERERKRERKRGRESNAYINNTVHA
jgi:hypothetical protein